jgi:hypothetical protein
VFWGVDPVYLEEQRNKWESHDEVFTLGKERDGEPVQLLNMMPDKKGDTKNGKWRAQLQ